MSRITKYALSDLYEMSSGISSTKEQAGHGAPFVSFSTVFNNYFLPDELPDLMDTNEKEQEIYSIKAGDVLICLPIRKDAYDLPDYDYVLNMYETVTTQMRGGLVKAAYALEGKGIAQAAAKMAFGNKLGLSLIHI